MKPNDVKVILAAHDAYWEDRRDEMERYKSVYEMEFWEKQKNASQIRIQTNDGYGYIESYQASLFAKNPAIVLKAGLKAKGNVNKSQHIVNNFLLKSRSAIESASRMALIYPNSFLKLAVTDREGIYDRVLPVAVPPWEVIVDQDSPRWDMQRYTGHIYWMTVPDAEKRFGGSFKADGVPMKNFFEKNDNVDDKKPEGVSDMFLYVKIVEMYDLMNDKLHWFTTTSDKWLDSADVIPFRDAFDEPVLPLVPMYYNRIPDQPMLGYSAMKRVYDQLYEMNIIRSFQANAVRKASRQWLVKKGSITEEEMAQVTSGVDGLFVEVESEDPLDTLIRPVPHVQIPMEVTQYMREVSKDKDSGSVTAPFTRGEVTKATATEIAALAAYTTSEIGRMARERDASIEGMALSYLAMMKVFLEEQDTPSMVLLDGKAEVVKAEDLGGDFVVFAADQASTPISEAIRNQRILQNAQLFQALGVPNQRIKEELVRTMQLPEDWLEEPPPAPMPEAGGAGIPSPAKEQAGGAGMGVNQLVGNPTPGNVSEQILGGGVGFTQ